MKKYPKIQSLYMRDMKGDRSLIEGEYSKPEFQMLKDIQWVCTEKVDGMNIRVGWDGSKVQFGGRTDKAQLPVDLIARLRELFEHKEDLFRNQFPDSSVCLYGEGFGAKIQKGGGLYSDTQDFVLFDVRVGDIWLKREDVVDIAKRFGLLIVPVVFSGTLAEIVQFVKEGQESVWGDFRAEGVVAHPSVELLNRMGERIIVKVKHKDFKSRVPNKKPSSIAAESE